MIYFDNSATTNPKPFTVRQAIAKASDCYSFNSGRGGYREAVNTAGMIYCVREKLAAMFGYEPQNIVFTNNCTTALNYAIKGSVSEGDHIIISSLEHNACSRPVYALAQKGIITYDVADFSYDREQTVNNFKSLIKPNTRLIVCMHASNVFGCLFPIKEIGELAREHGIRFVVDGAQTAGVIPISADDNVDILCAAGHKGLYGPMGTGFMAIKDGIKLNTIIEGGTGTASMELKQPDTFPEAMESGTLNNSGIIGLGAGVDFVNSNKISRINSHEIKLIQYLYKELEKNNRVTLYTPYPDSDNTAPILSFNLADYSSEKTAALLAKRKIAVRAGYHCSMLAHNHFFTANRGTVRLSPSVFTTPKECEIFINYLKKL